MSGSDRSVSFSRQLYQEGCRFNKNAGMWYKCSDRERLLWTDKNITGAWGKAGSLLYDLVIFTQHRNQELGKTSKNVTWLDCWDYRFRGVRWFAWYRTALKSGPGSRCPDWWLVQCSILSPEVQPLPPWVCIWDALVGIVPSVRCLETCFGHLLNTCWSYSMPNLELSRLRVSGEGGEGEEELGRLSSLYLGRGDWRSDSGSFDGGCLIHITIGSAWCGGTCL